MLHTQFRGPSPGLGAFVRFYTQREVRISGAAVVHPVPARTCPMLGFELCDSLTVRDEYTQIHRTSPKTVLVGLQTHRRLEMHLMGNLQSFYIMFRPEGFHRLFSVRMDEITDGDYEAHSVLGSFIPQVRDRLGECTSFEERVSLVEKLLMQRALQAPGLDGVCAAASRILQAGGQAAIPVLADEAGLSVRQFERRFIRQVGVRPKLFTRMARFEAALERKARFVSASWTEVAQEFGYYDQMHMVHDFAEFTGGTPSQTLAQLETLFVEPLRAMSRDRASAIAESNSRLIL